MSNQEIFQISKRKQVKKSQQSQKKQSIENDQSQGTQELSHSCDSQDSHLNTSQNVKNQTKNPLQAKAQCQKSTEQLQEKPKIFDQIGQKIKTSVLSHQELQKNSKRNFEHAKQQIYKKQQLLLEKIQEKKNQISSQIKRQIHILAVSDNHGDYKSMNQILQLKGDIFIHAGNFFFTLGDFTYQGKDEDFEKFFAFLDKVKFRHKIVIAGNHQNVLSKLKLKTITKMPRQKIISQLKKRCIYLQHEKIEIEGIKIFASSYTPQYCEKPTSRAFQYKPSQDKIVWKGIPKDTDLLITHGPPFGILDIGKNLKHAGSEGLKQAVLEIKPKYHIFGHIHESKGGMTKIDETIFINLCNTPTRLIMKV